MINITQIKPSLKLLLTSLMISNAFMVNSALANTATKNTIETPSCFENISVEANFIAFTTTKNSDLATWYQQLFVLDTVKEFAFPDGKTTGVLMHKKDFIIEVFFKEDVLIGQQQAPQSTNEQWQGINKVGVFTDADLPKLQLCLQKSGISATRIWQDKNLPIDLLQVIDPEKNVLEIISRRANK
jgi:hypothetical protein